MKRTELSEIIQSQQTTTLPLVEGVYTVKPRKPAKTLIFCAECQLAFFDRQILTQEDILSFIAAQQLAQQHANDLHHPVCHADPEQIM
jgi:hypothetical protein